MTKAVVAAGAGKPSLKELVTQFFQKKPELDALTKVVDGLNKSIKTTMLATGLDEFVVGDQKVTLTVQKSVSFNEAALMEFLRENKVKGVIKKKEYIDMDALENALYKSKIDPALLVPFQVERTSNVLRTAKADRDAGLEGFGQ